MHFTELITTARAIFFHYTFPENVSVLGAYLRILLRNRLLFLSKTKERLLSFVFVFPERAHFFSMLSDIFFRSVYRLPPGEIRTIIDAGSNIGLSALYFRWRAPEAHIICFEPNPEAFALLQRNIEGNAMKGVELHQLALGSEEGTTTLFLGNTLTADNSATTMRGDAKGRSVEVKQRKLSDFLSGPVDFLKMDIEGAEGDVLEELERAGKLSLIKRMAIEFHIYEAGGGYPMGKFLSILDRNDFRYVCTPSFSDIEHPSKKGMRTYIIQAKQLEG